METCHTLHLLDTRCDRQTRFFISIDATDVCRSVKMVAEFCQLMNRVLIASSLDGTGMAWTLEDPKVEGKQVSAVLLY